MDIKKRIQTIVIPYLSFGLLVLLYWQFIERRFRDSHRSFTDSLFGLFSGCYDNLDFNVHLWFLPCFFVTVVLSNTIVNLCSRKNSLSCFSSYELYLYYASNAGTSLGGGNRVFKYIGFYAVGVLLAGMGVSVIKKELGAEIVAIGLLALNYFLCIYNLTTGGMWFMTALIGVAGMILISQLINKSRILQYFGRISLLILCIHGPVYRIMVKIVSIALHKGTDAVRENFLLAMLIVSVTLVVCSMVYEVIIRITPWMLGKYD